MRAGEPPRPTPASEPPSPRRIWSRRFHSDETRCDETASDGTRTVFRRGRSGAGVWSATPTPLRGKALPKVSMVSLAMGPRGAMSSTSAPALSGLPAGPPVSSERSGGPGAAAISSLLSEAEAGPLS